MWEKNIKYAKLFLQDNILAYSYVHRGVQSKAIWRMSSDNSIPKVIQGSHFWRSPYSLFSSSYFLKKSFTSLFIFSIFFFSDEVKYSWKGGQTQDCLSFPEKWSFSLWVPKSLEKSNEKDQFLCLCETSGTLVHFDEEAGKTWDLHYAGIHLKLSSALDVCWYFPRWLRCREGCGRFSSQGCHLSPPNFT